MQVSSSSLSRRLHHRENDVPASAPVELLAKLVFLLGKLGGERAKAAGVDTVVFDRGGNRYHGRVAGIADGAREAGLTL